MRLSSRDRYCGTVWTASVAPSSGGGGGDDDGGGGGVASAAAVASVAVEVAFGAEHSTSSTICQPRSFARHIAIRSNTVVLFAFVCAFVKSPRQGRRRRITQHRACRRCAGARCGEGSGGKYSRASRVRKRKKFITVYSAVAAGARGVARRWFSSGNSHFLRRRATAISVKTGCTAD
jgi:hypothetical protein